MTVTVAGYEKGLCVRRDDPDGLGRIKVTVPGIIDGESANWAEPLGMPGSGGAKQGSIEPPPVGANVAVFFHRGDPDRPAYLCGQPGMPNGVSDVPTGFAIDTDPAGKENRQNVVTEDQEWIIERDSITASSPKVYRIKHKSTGKEIVLGSDGKIRFGIQAATEALIPGTTYRNQEALDITAIVTALNVISVALKLFKLDAGFAAAYAVLANSLDTAGIGVSAQSGILNASSRKTASNHLSTVVFTE